MLLEWLDRLVYEPDLYEYENRGSMSDAELVVRDLSNQRITNVTAWDPHGHECCRKERRLLLTLANDKQVLIVGSLPGLCSFAELPGLILRVDGLGRELFSFGVTDGSGLWHMAAPGDGPWEFETEHCECWD